MAAPPVKPVPSIVLKTPQPTAAQTAQQRAAKAATVPSTWDAHADPIIGAGPTGTGLHMTRSGRYVNGAGMYQGGVTPQTQAAAAQSRSGPSVVKTNSSGFVASPTAAAAHALLNGATPPAAPAPKVKVTIHPGGQVTVHTNHAPAAGASSPTVPSSLGPSAPGTAPDVNPPSVTKRAPAAQTTSSSGSYGSGSPPLYGGASDQAQAASIVKAQLDPLIQQITNAENQRSTQGMSAIAALTKQLQDASAGYAPAAKSGYDEAIGSQSVIDQALANRLGSTTTGVQGDLAGQLAKMASDPAAAAALAAKIGTFGTGAGNADFAKNAASLSALVGQKANAADYGAKLPAIATNTGLQQGAQLQQQTNTQLADNLAKLQATAPGLVQNVLASLSKSRTDQIALNQRQQTIDAATGTKAADLKIRQRQLDNQTATTLSNLYGVDANGNMTLAGRRVAALEANAQKKTGSLTAAQRASISPKIQKQADSFYYGVAPKYSNGVAIPGTGSPPVQYPVAVARLMATYSKAGYTLKDITNILNTYYQPGEGGRPMFTKQQAAINNSILPDPFAGLTTGH